MGLQSLSQMTAIPCKFGQGIHVEIPTTGNATQSQSLCVRELITDPTEHGVPARGGKEWEGPESDLVWILSWEG